MMFKGTIHLPEDPTRLPAVVSFEAGVLSIESEGQPIGSWNAAEVAATHRPDGIVLFVDGESIIVNPVDKYAFTDALEAARSDPPKRRGRRRRRKRQLRSKGRKSATSRGDIATAQPSPGPDPEPSPGHRLPSQDLEPLYPREPSPLHEEADDAGVNPPASRPDTPREIPVVELLFDPSEHGSEDVGEVEGATQDEVKAATAPSSRHLPPVEPPTPEGWPGLIAHGRPEQDDPFVGDPPSVSASTGATAWINDPAPPSAEQIDIIRPTPPPPEPPPPEPPPEPPPDPPSRLSALSNMIRSTPSEPILPGFRDTDDADEATPTDLTEQIFGPSEASAVKRGVLARAGDWWLDIPIARRRMVLAVAVGVMLWLLVPQVVASFLVLSGLAACLIGGAGMADPTYTRRLPPELSEVRLLTGGGIALVVGFLIGLPSL